MTERWVIVGIRQPTHPMYNNPIIHRVWLAKAKFEEPLIYDSEKSAAEAAEMFERAIDKVNYYVVKVAD